MPKTLFQARELIVQLAAKAGVVAPKVRSLDEARLKIEALTKATAKPATPQASIPSYIVGATSINAAENDNRSLRTQGSWREQVNAENDYSRKLDIVQKAYEQKKAQIEALPYKDRWSHYNDLKELSHGYAYIRQARDMVRPEDPREKAARKILRNQGLL